MTRTSATHLAGRRALRDADLGARGPVSALRQPGPGPDLDIIANPQHLTYKVPGLVVWSVVAFTAVGVWAFPHVYLAFARVLAFYMLFRMLLILASYLSVLVRCRSADRRVRCQVAAGATPCDDVHHVVLIPNYREPVEVLRRTLDGLARQQDAAGCITVVLAMEEKEVGAIGKAEALAVEYADKFARILITLHPAGLPGEVAGKGSNQAWAAREVKRELVDRQGLRLDRLTITSCDADSVLHPYYFAEISRLFANDPQPHRRIWQAPLRLDNNIWDVSVPIRLITYYTNVVHMAELGNLLAVPFPLSTYTLSYQLADEVGYWDPAVIAEDWHMYLRCFFATRGETKLVPVFLPTSGDAVIGDTVWQSLRNFYNQHLRHAWGAQDLSYILQQWHQPGVPFGRKLSRLIKVAHDHLVYTSAIIAIPAGTALALFLEGTPVITLPPALAYQWWLQLINVLGAISIWGLWIAERMRLTYGQRRWDPMTVVQELATWGAFPVLAFFVTGLPLLHAQTKLLLGKSLTYVSTPKRKNHPHMA